MNLRPIVASVVALSLLLSTSSALTQPGGPERDRPRDGGTMEQRLRAELDRLQEREAWILRRLESMEQDSETDASAEDGRSRRPDVERADRRSDQIEGDLRDDMREVMEDLRELGAAQENGMFQRLLERDTEASRRVLARMGPRVRELIDLKRNDREMYDLRLKEMAAGFEIGRAARRVGELMRADEADADALEEAKSELRDAVAIGFDAKAAVARRELDDVRTKLEALSEEVAQAEAERLEQIEERYTEILGRIETHVNEPHPRERGKPDARRERSGDD